MYARCYSFSFLYEYRITTHAFFGGGCIANFRNFKSLHVMEEDITVLKQLLSNTALLFRNRPVLPTHCGEMYVISR